MKNFNCILLLFLIVSTHVTYPMDHSKVSLKSIDPTLHMAVYTGQTKLVQHLLKEKVDVNIQDNNGNTPLHFAAGWGYPEIARLLLTSKALVNLQDNYGNTPLHLAAGNDRKDIVVLLLNHGAKEIPNNYHDTPTDIARQYNPYRDITNLFVNLWIESCYKHTTSEFYEIMNLKKRRLV